MKATAFGAIGMFASLTILVVSPVYGQGRSEQLGFRRAFEASGACVERRRPSELCFRVNK